MVPISLQLSNFLSYAEPGAPLDFTGFQTACLCGNNGHGKSAILDAITWALWGKARHDSTNMIRIGASEMRVEFVFELDGERIRITRGYTRKKSGGTPLLEVNIADDQSGLFRPLTRTSTRETQSLLDAMLRMDYETFLNSAYLRQGMADKFSRQAPGDRKRILAEILGLSRYQEIADRARADNRLEETKVAALEMQIESIERYLAGREEAQRQHDFYDDALKKLRPQIETLQQQVNELTERKISLNEARKNGEKLTIEIASEARKRDEATKTRGQLLAQKHELDDWQAQGETIVSNYETWRAADEERRKWEAIAEKYNTLGEQYRAAQDVLREAKAEIESQKNALAAQLEQQQRVLEAAQSRIENAGEVQQGAKELEAARTEEHRLGEQRRAFDAASRELHDAQNALRQARNALDIKLHQIENQIAELEKWAARRDEAQRVLVDAQLKVQSLNDAQNVINELQESRIAHATRIEQLKQFVDAAKSEIAALEQKLKVLQANPQAQCPLCESSLGEHGREHIEENIEDDIQKLRDRIDEYTTEARLEQKKKLAVDEPINMAQAVLRDAQKWHANEARAREITERCEDATKKIVPLRQEREHFQSQIESGDFAPEIASRVQVAQAVLANIEYSNEAHENTSRRVRELSRYETEIAALRHAEEQARGAQSQIEKLAPQIDELEATTTRGDFAPEAARQLAQLKAQADALRFDNDAKAAFRHAKNECERLQNATIRYEQFKAALGRAKDLEANLEKTNRVLEEHTTRLQLVEKERDALRDVAAKLAEVERTLGEQGVELDEARANERELNGALGGQKQFLAECMRRDEERQQLDEKRKTSAREAFVLKKTGEAFGKDGIQSLIIENAIPELQDNANEILRRLSRNRMQIALESQREKKSGGTSETLDIKISDERGTREYSLFSGGEAFRADFALRIALSKLLARRAGTQLRTLIIDEGFGTQDADGLSQMIECIQGISQDFDKVLVVTHLDAIKNAFPTRIEVTKDAVEGSRYSVVSG